MGLGRLDPFFDNNLFSYLLRRMPSAKYTPRSGI